MLQSEPARNGQIQEQPGETKAPTLAQQQWKLITLMLDRMCAITFITINIIAIILLLPMPSDEWKHAEEQGL